MSEKLVNFRMDEDKYNKLKMQALKEKITVKNLIAQQLEKYIKEHGDGNPQFTMDQFEDPNFIACPAFYRSLNTWDYYMSRASPEELQKLKNQIIGIDKKLGRHL